MTEYLLDTNVASELSRPRPNPQVTNWIRHQPNGTLYVSAIMVGEIRKGASLLPLSPRRADLEAWMEWGLLSWFDGRILPVTLPIADRWGQLDAKRQLSGRPISAPDGLIAATALEHSLTLVTRNLADFDGLDLSLFNPWAA